MILIIDLSLRNVQIGYYIVVGLTLLVPIYLVLLEIWRSLNDIEGDNINYNLFRWTNRKMFVIPFAWGIILGHLTLGSMKPLIANNTISVIVVALLCIAMIVAGKWKKSTTIPRSYIAFLIVLGAFVGHFIWSMNDYA